MSCIVVFIKMSWLQLDNENHYCCCDTVVVEAAAEDEMASCSDANSVAFNMVQSPGPRKWVKSIVDMNWMRCNCKTR